MGNDAAQSLRETVSSLVESFGAQEVLRVTQEMVKEIPEGAIRFKDACELYNIRPALLSGWIKKGEVEVVRRVSHKLVYVSIESVEARVRRLKLYREAMGSCRQATKE